MALTLESVSKLLDDLKKEILDGQSNLEQQLGKSLEQCFLRIDDNNKLIVNQQKLIEQQQNQITALQEDNKFLRAKVNELSIRQDDLDQYSRRNTLEIFGIPEPPNESSGQLKKTIVNIGVALGVTLEEEGIDACHRIKAGNNRPTTGIIVKFLRRDDPDQLLAKRKVKRDLSTRHLPGYQADDKPIYINLSLTPSRRVLFAKARQLRSEHGYKFVWVDRTGRIKVKKTDDGTSRTQTINTVSDLNELIDKESKNREQS